MHVGHVYAIPDPKGNRQIVERIDFEILPVSRVLSFGKRFSRNLGGVTSAGTKTTLAVFALLYARTGFGIWDLAGRPLRSLRKMECPSEANRKKEK